MKILSLENIDKITEPSVITIGMYDGVHIGHRQMLSELKQKALDINGMSIVITFANHPRSVLDKDGGKTLHLLQTTEERYNNIAQYGIDLIIPVTFTKEFALFSPKQFLDILSEKINIKFLLLGYDNRFGNPANNEYQELLAEGKYGDIIICKDTSGVYYNGIEVSSTQIRKAIAEGNVRLAACMLSSAYSITSTVVYGLQNGTKIGFPTANILIPDKKIIPKCGVYVTNTWIDGIKYKSVTNIGNNPTFNGQKTTVETHIIDFNKDIYGKQITVEFIDFIRDEKRFADTNDLSLQMKKDTAYAKNFLS